MNSEEIIELCEKNKSHFRRIIEDIPYESKGIFNSEMLLFVTLAKYFNIAEIWESGRARGQSTKIIAEYFRNSNINLYSIESESGTEDDLIALKRLQNNNIELFYGNSVQILPQRISAEKDTIVLIDGPKGTTAIQLAEILLKHKNIKAVFLHDYHKDSPLREVVEKTFKQSFFTDNEQYVEKFKDLDAICWEEHSKIGRLPYARNGKQMKSYSSTLCVIFNKL